jgi:hypothetical protein
MGNTNCKSLVTNYIVTIDPYYKLHYLVSLILFGLLYFNYLKDQEFAEYENRFVVFMSKYILMPLILNYLVSLVFFYIIQLWRRKLISRAVRKCGGRRGDDMTDGDLRQIRSEAMREVNRSSSKRSSSKRRSSPKRRSPRRSPKSSPKR